MDRAPRAVVISIVGLQIVLSAYFWQNPRNLWNDGDGIAAVCERSGFTGCNRLPSFVQASDAVQSPRHPMRKSARYNPAAMLAGALKRYWRAVVSTIALLVSTSVALSAQRTVTRSIFVSAADGAGRPVLDLGLADFRVTESGAKREVTRATLGSAPMRIVLMVDSSTPVGPMINSVKKALAVFIETLPPQHEVAGDPAIAAPVVHVTVSRDD